MLGFHKRIVCPSCGYHFAFGIPVDIPGAAADTTGSDSLHEVLPHRGAVRCPNCGQDAIDAENVPPNYGDQLLVQKNAYEFRRPRRWEVVVLNGPVRPVPPFVKRIVGLPNEAVQIIDGDIYADGHLCRKELSEQLAVRIPVFDNAYLPNDPPDGRGDWVIESAKSPWRSEGHGFVAAAAATKAAGGSPGEISWLAFHHWVRHGGTYRTEVAVDALPQNVHVSHGAYPQLRYDPAARRFLLIGALDKSRARSAAGDQHRPQSAGRDQQTVQPLARRADYRRLWIQSRGHGARADARAGHHARVRGRTRSRLGPGPV